MDTSPSSIPPRTTRSFSLPSLLVKTLLLFIALNLLLVWVNPLPLLGRISVYNHLVPGRLRLPYGDDPAHSYNLSLYQLESMFAAHAVEGTPKAPDEYRVILIGDSATWGYLLEPDQTLAAAINRAGIRLPDGRTVQAYNLGYPVMSLMKDLLVLSYAVQYDPDLIIWPVTLESLPYDKQLFPPLLQNNPEQVRELIRTYQLNLNPNDPELKNPSFWQKTLFGQRRNLADMFRLQVYGLLWAATGIDQGIPANTPPRLEDLSADLGFHNLQPPHLARSDLALDILQAGIRMAGNVPVVIINEPMFISHGQNSNLRYNFYYPRWAYDDFRKLMAAESKNQGWQYLDFWDAISPDEFTNTAVHMSPAGTQAFADLIGKAIRQTASQTDHP